MNSHFYKSVVNFFYRRHSTFEVIVATQILSIRRKDLCVVVEMLDFKEKKTKVFLPLFIQTTIFVMLAVFVWLCLKVCVKSLQRFWIMFVSYDIVLFIESACSFIVGIVRNRNSSRFVSVEISWSVTIYESSTNNSISHNVSVYLMSAAYLKSFI